MPNLLSLITLQSAPGSHRGAFPDVVREHIFR